MGDFELERKLAHCDSPRNKFQEETSHVEAGMGGDRAEGSQSGVPLTARRTSMRDQLLTTGYHRHDVDRWTRSSEGNAIEEEYLLLRFEMFVAADADLDGELNEAEFAQWWETFAAFADVTDNKCVEQAFHEVGSAPLSYESFVDVCVSVTKLHGMPASNIKQTTSSLQVPGEFKQKFIALISEMFVAADIDEDGCLNGAEFAKWSNYASCCASMRVIDELKDQMEAGRSQSISYQQFLSCHIPEMLRIASKSLEPGIRDTMADMLQNCRMAIDTLSSWQKLKTRKREEEHCPCAHICLCADCIAIMLPPPDFDFEQKTERKTDIEEDNSTFLQFVYG